MDEKLLSIDNSLPHHQFHIENARENLRHLQTHVHSQFAYGLNKPIVGDSMAGQGSHNNHLYNRQESVPEEALFSQGPDSDEDTSKNTDTGAPVLQLLPNFDLITGSSGSSDHDDKSPRNNSETNVNCSIGAVKKRKQFRISSSNTAEVFEGDDDNMNSAQDYLDGARPTISGVTDTLAALSMNTTINANGNEQNRTRIKNEIEQSVNKEQSSIEDVFEDDNNEGRDLSTPQSITGTSLPDVILSSSSSGHSASSFGHTADSPDVTASGDGKHLEKLQRRKEVRDIIEGPSSIGEIPDLEPNKKKKLSRAVSFSECTEQRIIGVGQEMVHPSVERVPLKDEPTRPSLPSTPCTPDEKRFRYSQSSGYVTGSDRESQEGASDKGSMESSQAWSSTESNNASDSVEFSDHILKLIQETNHVQNTHPVQKGLDSNDNSLGGSDSNSSVHTVINSGASTTDTSLGSNMHSSATTKTTRGENLSKSIEESFEIDNTCLNKFPRPESTAIAGPEMSNADDSCIPCLSIFSESDGMKPLKISPTHPTLPPGELHANVQPQSYIPSNPSTFSLTSSQVEKVAKENERIVQTGRNKILGQDAGKQSLSPESLPGAATPSHQQPRSMKEIMWMHLEDRLNRDGGQMSPVSIQRWVHLCIGISDSSTPSPSPQLSNMQLSPDNHSFKVIDLERASRCTDSHCKEMCCIKFSDIKRMLRLDIPELDHGYPLLLEYCQSLWKHNNNCDELACQILYCDQVSKWDLSRSTEEDNCRQMVEEIQKLLVEPVMSTDVDQSADGDVIKLLDDLPRIDKEEFETSFLAVSQLGEFGTDLLCCDMKTGLLYAQQTFPMFEESHQLAVYDRLRNLKHPNIVTQLYLIPCEESIKVYSIFLQGGSLLEFIKLRGALPWSLTVHYMKQILTAVIELHKLGLVYLYWHSGNMLFPDCSRQVVKLGSFGYSYPKNCKSDLGATKFCLPHNLCPPELLRQNRIDFLSDSWGAGCLMAEMHTGRPIWYKERHETRERVHENIKQNFPKVDTETTNQKTAFEYCWQPQPERRKTIEELYHHLESSSRESGVS